ncbi:hypothetical protein PoB_002929300 [Plakobranchus ocellatus]|uniref:Uncharacterized protein n=1 Tax=Plakobranchus ocellatus TaxID=259542 RepID=A0AAV4A821_9GAST|nr:hypothetical protein PoB_002929300 [Plakobranchus ocellatus]
MSGVTFRPFQRLKRQLEKCREWITLCNRLHTDLNMDKIGGDHYVCSKVNVASTSFYFRVTPQQSHTIVTKLVDCARILMGALRKANADNYFPLHRLPSKQLSYHRSPHLKRYHRKDVCAPEKADDSRGDLESTDYQFKLHIKSDFNNSQECRHAKHALELLSLAQTQV